MSYNDLYDICVNILYTMRQWAIDIIGFMQYEITISGTEIPLYMIMFGSGIITFLLIKLVF